METSETETMDLRPEPTLGRPKVVSHYLEYSPPFDVESLVESMLTSIPPKFLNGLSEVILTNAGCLSRRRRRSVTKSRGRKVRIANARGAYHPAYNNHLPWIEIFVDNTLERWEGGWWLKIGLIREISVGGVLFHEIGHHIHFTRRPEHREKEDVADDWKSRLAANWYKHEHPWLRTAFWLFRPVLRFLIRRRYGALLRDGRISRAEFDREMRGFRSK